MLEFRLISASCSLVIEPGEYHWGDFYKLGDSIVFVPILDDSMDPLVYEGLPNKDNPIIRVDKDCTPLYSRGVYVMPSCGVNFNPALMKRIYGD